MIRVTVELISAVDASRNRKLGMIEICNDGTGTEDTGCYDAILQCEYTRGRKGRVMGFNRRQQSVMSLVGAFLKLWGHTSHSPKQMTKQ